MRKIVFIALAIFLVAALLVAGCNSGASSNYRSQDQARTYNAPQGQYAGGCGVTAPADITHEPSAPDADSMF